MKSLIKQLYYGKISPWEHLRPKNPEYHALWDKIEKQEAYLAGKLPAEERETFTEYQELIRQADCMETYEGFSHGFRLGMNLLWEVVSTDP